MVYNGSISSSSFRKSFSGPYLTPFDRVQHILLIELGPLLYARFTSNGLYYNDYNFCLDICILQELLFFR